MECAYGQPAGVFLPTGIQNAGQQFIGRVARESHGTQTAKAVVFNEMARSCG